MGRVRGASTMAILALTVAAGCTTKVPPPKPPVFGELVEFDLGEAPLAETEAASQAIAETIQIPRKATLRIKGAYRADKPDQYFPVSAAITRKSPSGTPVSHAGGGATVVKEGDSTYAFTIDVESDQPKTGEFDLILRAGKQFIAHGKVVVKD